MSVHDRILSCLLLVAGLTSMGWCLPALAIALDPDISHLTLARAIVLMKSENHDLRIASANVEAAQADLEIASERPNPELSVSTSPTRLHGNNGSGVWRQRPVASNIQWDHPIERGGKRRLRRSVAEAQLAASRNDGEAAYVSQLQALSEAYYTQFKNQQKVHISKEMAEAYHRSVMAAEKRLQARHITTAEVARLRVEAALAGNEVRKAEHELAQSRIVLARLLGLETHADRIAVEAEWPSTILPPAVDIKALAGIQPEVKAANALLESARAAAALARAQLNRDITLSLSYAHEPSDIPNSISVGVSLPLFVGNAYSGEIQRADADLNNAQATLDSIRGEVVSQLTVERDNLETAADILKPFREDIIANAANNKKAVEFAYAHGSTDILELIDARSTLYQVQMDALEAEAEFATQLTSWAARLPSQEPSPI